MLRQGAQGRERADELLLDQLLRSTECFLLVAGHDRLGFATEVEARIQHSQRPLERDQRARQEQHRSWRPQPVTLDHLQHAAQGGGPESAGLDLPQQE